MSTEQFRPLITVVRPSADGGDVEVTLDQHGWIADGVAPVAEGDLLSAASRATCIAVSSLLPENVEVSFATLQHLTGDQWDREIVLASVMLTDHGGEPEELLGAAWVRSDQHVAAVRATLDALTRRLSQYLPA